MKRFHTTRESYIPKGSVCIRDKNSDAIAYVYTTAKGKYGAAVFFGKQTKPYCHYTYQTEARREADVARLFKSRQETSAYGVNRKAERAAKSAEFQASLQIGDIFHHSYGYDETHHVFHEVVGIKGRYATVRPIQQAQQDLGYDCRHRCMPQSGAFIGEPVRVLIQDGMIKVDQHYHASKWNTSRVAGVPVGPAYTGGGMH